METVTENGENAFSTTSNANLDLFVSLVRSIETERLIVLLEKSWVHDPELTLKMILYARDRYGAGEKFLSFRMMVWLMYRFKNLYSLNLREFVKLGKLHDLLRFIRAKQIMSLNYDEEIDYFIELLKDNNHNAFKWAPSEGKEFNDISKIFRNRLNMNAKQYRQFLTAGRKQKFLIEPILCQKIDTEVNFSKVPSQAMFKYKNTLSSEKNHLHEQYISYLRKVEQGEVKINSGTLMPYQLINETDQASNILWNDLIKNLKNGDNEQLKNSIAICDVSGSMAVSVGQGVSAIDVAISLSLVLAELSNHRKIISFSKEPTLLNIPEDTLLTDKVHMILRAPWGMNTDIIAVFKMILEKEIDVKYIFVFTDMQFDMAVSNNDQYETSYDKCSELFAQVGKKIPQVIYWNVSNSRSAFPVQQGKRGTALLSGFSSALFKSILNGDDISPVTLMKRIIDPYNIVYQVEERKAGLIPWEKIEPKLMSRAKNRLKRKKVMSEFNSESD